MTHRPNMLPNQGSNLDFTDPESVVLPITPLGIISVTKLHFFSLCQVILGKKIKKI